MGPHPAVAAIRLAVRRVLHDILNEQNDILNEQNGRPATPVAELTEDPDLLAAIKVSVAEANRAVSSAEGIKKFRVLPVDWTEQGGHLTPSLKMKRAVIMRDFADDVEALYPRH